MRNVLLWLLLLTAPALARDAVGSGLMLFFGGPIVLAGSLGLAWALSRSLPDGARALARVLGFVAAWGAAVVPAPHVLEATLAHGLPVLLLHAGAVLLAATAPTLLALLPAGGRFAPAQAS